MHLMNSPYDTVSIMISPLQFTTALTLCVYGHFRLLWVAFSSLHKDNFCSPLLSNITYQTTGALVGCDAMQLGADIQHLFTRLHGTAVILAATNITALIIISLNSGKKEEVLNVEMRDLRLPQLFC
jgi:hypothetical protein